MLDAFLRSQKELGVVRDLRPENVAPVGAAESGAG